MQKYFIALLFLLITPMALGTNHPITKIESDLDKMPVGEYELDKATSSLTWKVNHLGLSTYTARFAQIDASLYLHSSSLEKSKVIAVISPLSIVTDYPYRKEKDFDHELSYSEKWFNSKKYNKIKFHSTKIKITGSNTGKMHGILSMLGKKKPITLDVTFNKAFIRHPQYEKPVMGFSARGTIKRSDWGMTHLIPDIGDKIEILIESEFIKKRV